MPEENEAGPFWVEWTGYDSWDRARRRSCSFAHLEDAKIEAKRLQQEHRCMVTIHTGDGSDTPKVFHYVIERPPEE